MEQEIINSYNRLNSLNVSRETYMDFEFLISMIIEKNKKINIISQETAKKKVIRDRHIIDSAQIIDFIDLNSNTTSDLGSGGGMPGLIIAIMMKNLKKDMKVQLYEKSYHKCMFLKDVSRKLKLNTEIVNKDITSLNNIETGTIMCRAFKPMSPTLELVNKCFKNYKNLIFFMGRSGKKILDKTLLEWDLDFEKKKSITSDESFLLNIKTVSYTHLTLPTILLV